jgi:hypothetical protein
MKRMFLTGLALLLLLASCAPYMYGVPQETWDRMSERERIEAMRTYEREQEARRRAAEERARRQAIEEQARRQAAEEQARVAALERQREQARQAALERERRDRIERIHRGDGAYGELIRVRFQGGTIRIGDRFHRYEPLTFTIAEGESRRIAVADLQGRVVDMVVTYAGGALSLEGARFPYDRSWGRGRLYSDIDISGAMQLRDVDVFIEVQGRSSRFDREPSRLVVTREPEPVVIREREHPKPPPVVIKEKEPPRPPVIPATPPAVGLPPGSVEVVLLSGELKLQGRMQPLDRISIRIADGESRDLVVKAGGESRTITFFYDRGDLYVDGTPGKGRYAERISYDKEWRSGKVYRLNMKGKGQLEKLELKVTGIAK